MSPRSRILALLVLALLALPAAGEKTPGITIKRDGDDVVLIPQPGKVYLILGFPYEKKGQEPVKGHPGQLSYLTGKTRLPVKEYARIQVWELGQTADVDLERGGLRPVSARPVPLKPYCPPDCPVYARLLQGR